MLWLPATGMRSQGRGRLGGADVAAMRRRERPGGRVSLLGEDLIADTGFAPSASAVANHPDGCPTRPLPRLHTLRSTAPDRVRQGPAAATGVVGWVSIAVVSAR